MIWGAHEVDGRIAARAAVKLRAALRQSIDAKRLFQLYAESDPLTTDNEAQDNARARAWAMINMLPNNQAVINALMYLWAEAFVLGEDSANEALRQAREAKKAPETGVDWANWKPGDRASALLITPPKAFQSLLSRSGLAIRGLDKTGYDRVGTALARSIRLGLGDTNAAKLINDAIGDPSRALTIAITETNRAVSLGAMKTYREAGLEKMEWAVSDPCPECAQNSGQVVEIGGTFNSGSQQPPAHPNCRCALLPVLPEYETNELGVRDVMTPTTSAQPVSAANLHNQMTFQRRAGFDARSVPFEQESALNAYRRNSYTSIQDYLRNPDEFLLREGAERTAIVRDAAKNLDDLIRTAPSLKESVITYRGVAGDIAENFAALKPGDVIQDAGFSSTSYLKTKSELYLGDQGVMLEVVNPAGTRGVNVEAFFDDLKPDDPIFETNAATKVRAQYEWLLPKNSTFKVISNDGKVIRVMLNG